MTPFELTDIQAQVLLSLHEKIDPARISRIWIFPAHRIKARETGLAVIALLPDAEDRADMYAVHTLRYHASSEKGKLHMEQSLSEEGRTTADRIDRVIAGVLARSGTEPGEPIVVEVGGDAEAWDVRLDELGARVDPMSR